MSAAAKKRTIPTLPVDRLELRLPCPLVSENGGLFVCPGYGQHPDRVIRSFELIFVRSGTLRMIEGGRALQAAAGQSLLLWPGRRHRGDGVYERGLSFWWVHFRLPRGHAAQSATTVSLEQVTRVARPDRLAELFHRFVDDQQAGVLRRESASLMVQMMLSEVVRPRAAPVAPPYAELIAARAQAYVEAHLADTRLRTSHVATALELNSDYLNRAFRLASGQTLTAHVHQRRLRQACALLRETLWPIKQIARACGFADVNHFRRLFKRQHDTTPATYRRRYMRLHINTR